MAEIGRHAAAVLAYDDPGELDVAQPLGELGFDSMMAVNMRNALMEDGIDLPLYLLNGGPSVVELAAYAVRMADVDPDEVVVEERIPMRVIATHGAAFLVGSAVSIALMLLLINLFPGLASSVVPTSDNAPTERVGRARGF